MVKIISWEYHNVKIKNKQEILNKRQIYLPGKYLFGQRLMGLAGLIWATKYGTDNASIRSRIENMADQEGSIYSVYGIARLNAYKAVAP